MIVRAAEPAKGLAFAARRPSERRRPFDGLVRAMKSKKGIATPKAELDLIRLRLARAKEDYEQWRRNRPSP